MVCQNLATVASIERYEMLNVGHWIEWKVRILKTESDSNSGSITYGYAMAFVRVNAELNRLHTIWGECDCKQSAQKYDREFDGIAIVEH